MPLASAVLMLAFSPLLGAIGVYIAFVLLFTFQRFGITSSTFAASRVPDSKMPTCPNKGDFSAIKIVFPPKDGRWRG